MQEDGLRARVENLLDVVFGKLCLAVDDHLGAVEAHHLAGVLVNEVLNPCLDETGGKLAAHCLLEVLLGDLYLLGQTEDFYNVLVAFQTDGSQQRGHGQFLLSVDVGIHDIVDVSGKFYP